ncbi:uncharacterized protein LOC135503209 [Lineus longissimus]|uniref:uncharacterized protein LOC135503209 n=1 Tax=Lineus longissimus TaxID=88925 RepID=UPI00315E0195
MAEIYSDPQVDVRFGRNKNRVHLESAIRETPEVPPSDATQSDFDLEFHLGMDEDTFNEMMSEDNFMMSEDNFMDGFNLEDLLHSLNGNQTEEVLPFQHGEKSSGLCQVCFDYTTTYRRPCCSQVICDNCIKQYCITDVKEGILKIHCPILECKSFITKDEIVYRLPNDLKLKFSQYLTDANADPCIKTCPRCSHITKLGSRATELHKRKVKKYGLCMCCTECDLKWCFPCQAPWHEGVTCKKFRMGDNLVKDWAEMLHPGLRTKNAVKCPKCKIFIERTEGCDHMHCSKCDTDFCYRCGDKFRSLKFLGNHHSRYSVFGCKYRLKPEKPHERKLIRGAILASKILAVPCVGVVAVGAGAIILVAGAVLGPFYGVYKLHQARMRKKRMKEWKTSSARTDASTLGRPIPMNQFGDSGEKMADFDDDDEDLEFYDVIIPIEKLQDLQMKKSDMPMHDYGTHFHGDRHGGFLDSESDLSERSYDYADLDLFNHPWGDDLEPPHRCHSYDFDRHRRGRDFKGSRMGRESLSSDSDLEELDSGVMFVLDSAGKVYSSDNSSLRASKDTIVEYVAAVSETTHL